MAFRADEFDSDTAQDLKTGGDGRKFFQWSCSGTGNADAFDVNTTNAGYLTFDLNATNSRVYYNEMSAPYAYQLITGNFDVETLYTSNNDQTWEGGFLIAASNSNQNIHCYIQEFTNGTTWYVGVRTSDGSSEPNVGADVTSATAAGSWRYWRLVRSGNDFTFYRKKASGDAWTSHGTTTRSDIGSTVRVGLGAQTQNTNNNLVVQFDYWRGTVANTRDYPAAQTVARQAVQRAATR